MICRKFPKDNIQPPLSYYLEIINKFGFKDIVIVTEKDLRNPCIKQLKELMPDLKIQTSNLLDDMSTIMSARNLIVGQSSFSLCVGLASDKIKRIFIPQFDITNWFFHSRGYIAPNIYRYFLVITHRHFRRADRDEAPDFRAPLPGSPISESMCAWIALICSA